MIHIHRRGRAVLPALLLGLIVATACGRREEEPAPRTPDRQTASLGQLAQELDRLQGDVQQKNREIARLLEHYQKNGGRLPDNFGPDLNEEQRQLLAQRFHTERLGLRATLQDILDRDHQIVELKGRIADIEGALPSSLVAAEGDTHEGLLRRYLDLKGIKGTDADSLIVGVNLQTPLLPGHRVWIFQHQGTLGTWVTAGDASLTPQDAAKQAMKLIEDQRDEARGQAQDLRGQLKGAHKERATLQTQVADLQGNIGEWSREAETMRNVARAAAVSAHYVAGTKKQLRDRGVITGGFLRGTRVRRLDRLDALDLTQSHEIVLRASEHDLARIRKVRLLPDGFERGQDYDVHLLRNGSAARVAFLDVDKFQRATFVVVLE
jgi:hypothetical protein